MGPMEIQCKQRENVCTVDALLPSTVQLLLLQEMPFLPGQMDDILSTLWFTFCFYFTFNNREH